MSKGTSKAQLRASKAGKYYKSKSADELEDEEVQQEEQQSSNFLVRMIQENFPDPVSAAAGLSLLVMLVVLAVLIWVNTTGSIEPYTRNGPLEVDLLDTDLDTPPSAKSKDQDDLLETYTAVDNIERAVQHGNIPAARMILEQLTTSKILSESDIEALRKLIDDSEALNPIADISKCVVGQAMELVEEKGGKFIKSDGEIAVIMADFDQDQEQPDGRGRGIAALVEAKEGEVLMEVPVSSGMGLWAAEKSPTMGKVVKELKLKSFQALALQLLHESHDAKSPHRKHICSLPLHVPLPFLWSESDLPEDFLARPDLNAARQEVRELVDLSYNMTVPAVLEKFPEMFAEEQLSRPKWSWACSIVLSRSLAMSRSFMGSHALENATALDVGAQMEILKGTAKETAVHVLLPAIDMINHESSDELSCKLKVNSDGTVVITSSPSGLKRGYEIAVSYGDHLCGTRPLNRWGFVLPVCPGDEEEPAPGDAGAADSGGEPSPEEGAAGQAGSTE